MTTKGSPLAIQSQRSSGKNIVAKLELTMSSESDLMLDVGLANEIKLAARRVDATRADLKWLSEGDNLSTILPVIRGQAEVVVKKHIIDCDADPFVPDMWSVEKHIKSGEFEWNPEKVLPYLCKKQEDGGTIEGNKLRKELKGKPVLNANVLDYLLAHPHLILEEWKSKYVFFWGTIYRHSDGGLVVRGLRWNDGGWYWDGRWLVYVFGDDYPAALAK